MSSVYYLVLSGNLPVSLEVGDLVPLEQHLDPAGQRAHSLALLPHHSLEVELHLTHLYTALREVAGLGHVVVVGVVKKGLNLENKTWKGV